MGDRRMAELKLEHGSLFLYVHSHGSFLPALMERAVVAAKRRLGDEPYWTRIVIDQVFKDLRDVETGGGIMLRGDCEDAYNSDRPSVIVDAETGEITIIEKGLTISKAIPQ